jgi:hypothetical protein
MKKRPAAKPSLPQRPKLQTERIRELTADHLERVEGGNSID